MHAICEKIEKDLNFGSKLTQHQLKLIARTYLNITDTPITLAAQDRELECGKLYSVLRASYEADREDDKFYWSATTMQIWVHKDGSVSFYNREDLELKCPLENISLDNFLGKPVLIGKLEKQEFIPATTVL